MTPNHETSHKDSLYQASIEIEERDNDVKTLNNLAF